MKKQLLPITLIICPCTTYAQQISTSGGSTSNENFSAQWIIAGSSYENSV
jgi:hypothetical protein